MEKYVGEVLPALVREPDEGWLWLRAIGERMIPTGVGEIVRDYVNAADPGNRGGSHLFSHTMATLMIEGGAAIRFIQQLLGRAELSTAQIYTQVSIRQLKQIPSATHPARLERNGRLSKCENGG